MLVRVRGKCTKLKDDGHHDDNQSNSNSDCIMARNTNCSILVAATLLGGVIDLHNGPRAVVMGVLLFLADGECLVGP